VKENIGQLLIDALRRNGRELSTQVWALGTWQKVALEWYEGNVKLIWRGETYFIVPPEEFPPRLYNLLQGLGMPTSNYAYRELKQLLLRAA